jgi:hypothetical protein
MEQIEIKEQKSQEASAEGAITHRKNVTHGEGAA